MKILHVCPRYYPFIGGVEEHVKNICERIVQQHDVSVYTTDPSRSLPQNEIINNVKITRFPSWAPNEAYYFSSKLKEHLSETSVNFDIVHAHNYATFPALYAAQSKPKIFFFTPHYHGGSHTFLRSLFHRPYKIWGKKIFGRADKVICVSKYEMSLIRINFKNLQEKMILIPNGVAKNEFEKIKRRKKENLSILTVSRLESYKGIQYLIKILPKLSEDIFLQIVGKGPYNGALVKLAKEMNLTGRVEFHADLKKNDLLQKYVDADVFVSLSKHEAYGLSVAEALSAGTPCIVANRSVLTEWVDNKNCYGIDYPIDLEALKNLIENIIIKRERAEISKVLDWCEVVEKTNNLYFSSFG